ncbi:DUF3237 family protein [Acetivibrio cellulolyticus]|uniref:DUF3237 family protein n=1 Tax=Acetivibrio cellulolyticus TaxID=35830 RepID=UPI0001E2BD96|nr:DUF3237 family protein [Acetivibrio cellulolyticus]
MKSKWIFTTIFVLFILSNSLSFSFAAELGDLNSDNNVNSIDFGLYRRCLLGLCPFEDPSVADLDGDGSANSIDFGIFRKFLLGIITEFPATTPKPTPTPQSGDEDKILIPHKSWTCGMADGIPKPESGVLAFEINMKLDQIYNMGKTQYGQRQVFVIQGGTITGSKISGSVMSGGLDFQLDLSNGAMEIEQILVFKTNDGNYVYFRSAGTAANQNDVRIVPNIEAPNNGSYSWINSGKFACRRIVDTAAKTIKISVYDISGVTVRADSTNSIAVTKPTDVQYQSWDFRKAFDERKGTLFITEDVALAGSQTVGATKNNISRNIIPITGGTVTGSLNGKIIAAGADYQNTSNPMTIDARYLWQTNDGEIIIVRNAGQFGSLVPTFEVRADSKYSYLNSKLYLSSDPGMGSGGGVKISFYESTK